jgi:hypothetical protein
MTKYLVLIIAFLTISFDSNSQSLPRHFPFGTYANLYPRYDDPSIWDLGINTIIDSAYSENWAFLENFDKSIALNMGEFDWIHNYGGGYYNKWEAEENLQGSMKAGIKHDFGEYAIIDGIPCWTVPQAQLASMIILFMVLIHLRKDNIDMIIMLKDFL